MDTKHPTLLPVWGLLCAAALLCPGPAQAEAPVPVVTYAGFLERGGVPANGDYTVTIALWDADVDGNILCAVPGAVVTVSGGHFTLPLIDGQNGDCLPVVYNDTDLDAIYVEVSVDPGEGVTTLPRHPMGSVPFAIEAGNAATVGGYAASEFQMRVTGSCPDGDVMVSVGMDGNVGCVTASSLVSYSAGEGLQLTDTTFSLQPGGVTGTHLSPNLVHTGTMTVEGGFTADGGAGGTNMILDVGGPASGGGGACVWGRALVLNGGNNYVASTLDQPAFCSNGDVTLRAGINVAYTGSNNVSHGDVLIRGGVNDDVWMKVEGGNGNVGIGTTAPGYKLQVNGNSANATGVWAVTSDRRLKREIKPIDNALETIESLQGVSYRWKDVERDAASGRVRGFVAQDVEQVVPDWVHVGEDGYRRLETVGMNAVLVEAIKEQSKLIRQLQARIEDLEQR